MVMLDIWDYHPTYDARSDEEVEVKIKDFERKKLEELLMTSDNPAIVDARTEALAITKLVSWADYEEQYAKEHNRLKSDLRRYKIDVAENKLRPIKNQLDKLEEEIDDYFDYYEKENELKKLEEEESSRVLTKKEKLWQRQLRCWKLHFEKEKDK